MDTEALRKEEERLLRAISRGGASRPPVWSSPSKNPNPTATTPKSTVIKPSPITTPTPSQSNPVSPRQKSVVNDEERQRLEREALEREKQRERERLEAERLEKEVFEQKRMASRTSLYSYFDTSPRISSSEPTEPKTTTKPVQPTVAPESRTSTSTTIKTTGSSTDVKTSSPKVVSSPPAQTQGSVPSSDQWAENMDNLIASLVSSEPPQTPSQPTVTSFVEPTPIPEPTQSTTVSTPPPPPPTTTTITTTTSTFPTRSAHEIAFESAQQKLSTLKWQLARPLGPAQQKDLVSYIRGMIEKVKEFKTYIDAPTDDPSTFPFTGLANSFEAFVESILDSLSLIISSDDRQEIVSQLLSLLESTIDFLEAVYSCRNVIEAYNKMGDNLQNLVKTITNTTRRQAERQQQEEREREVSRQQKERNELIEVVQEAAKHAEKISELLKSQEFDATLFKEQLALLVAAVRKIDSYISDDVYREKIISSTKAVLERAIELQQSGGGQSSRLPVITSITELLRCLTIGLQQQ